MIPQKSSASSPLELHADEVVVWLVSLDVGPGEAAGFQALLPDDELERASRFPFERERRRFVVTRGVLRLLLGRYLQRPPAGIGLRYNAFGKPFLDPAHGSATLRFNLSHSGDKALLAFSAGRELGVDLEAIRPEFAAPPAAQRFFSHREQAELFSLSPDRTTLAFYLCWTRKEAFVKALGKGLSVPLDSFDVSLTPGEPALLRSARGSLRVADWHLVHLDVDPGYAAALVGSGPPFTVRLLPAPFTFR